MKAIVFEEEALRRMGLTNLERRIIELAQAGLGRNAIAAALGISVSTVKTLRRRIRWKVGYVESFVSRDLPAMPKDDAPSHHAEPEVGQGRSADHPEGRGPGETAEGTDGRSASASELAKMAAGGRRLAALILVYSRRDGVLLKVTGVQRLWLQPVLTRLQTEGRIRLLAVDREDVYAPVWLPIVTRGRRAVRGAYYRVREGGQQVVLAAIADYLYRGGLRDTFENAWQRLWETARILGGGCTSIPTRGELLAIVGEAFGLEGVLPGSDPSQEARVGAWACDEEASASNQTFITNTGERSPRGRTARSGSDGQASGTKAHFSTRRC
ncbi:MAG: LuxR C-terminal-related transcriptional regulator [Clostridia bacterium]|jgi:hypothetical protein|nr:LuxR C-terminal-related transcriptional regulator [Clostridia bacterium]MDH7573976.1 LuxR C-terminal-related transcriptional regulator [Clostridia bacterium]